MRGVAVAAAALFFGACSPAGRTDGVAHEPEIARSTCDRLQDARRHSGISGGFELEGRTTIDVNQYRVEGRFHMQADADGNLVFEFNSTVALGGHREDVVFSFWADTLRVLDRERGAYYEGEGVDELVSDGVGSPVDLPELIHRLLLGERPRCERFRELVVERDRIRGRLDDGAVDIRFDSGRVRRATWPSPLPQESYPDRLEVEYRWDGAALDQIQMRLVERKWRIRLYVD